MGIIIPMPIKFFLTILNALTVGFIGMTSHQLKSISSTLKKTQTKKQVRFLNIYI